MTANNKVAMRRRLDDLVALIDEMIIVAKEENRVLAAGLPVSRPVQLRRKMELAESFEAWAADVSAKRIDFKTFDEPVVMLIAERTADLHVIMDENVVMLRAAIEASRRRIEAVMSAVRCGISESSPYTANGRIGGVSVSCSTSVRV